MTARTSPDCFTSSYSNNGGACVEVASASTGSMCPDLALWY
ncbi:DUF397 domain-containing protein [Streptomyces sp. BE147]|nr:DUF397 domain-containing protein [Streptomyces sp. BE147]